MRIDPAPTRDYRITSAYIGPDQERGRLSLLRSLSWKASMIRASHTSTRPIHKLAREVWECTWIANFMAPRGAEAFVYAAWRRVRNRWIAAGCPASVRPWDLVERQ